MTLTIAIPKGRIQQELDPVLKKIGIEPEASYRDENSRSLRFSTNQEGVYIIRVRSFDVATFTAFGGAEIGIAGGDVLMEFDYPDIYAPLDLRIGHCRLSLAAPKGSKFEDLKRLSHVKVATKYPNITQKYFSDMGIQAECIKLNGAMELAPSLGLTQYIVDLVSSGKTLDANGLEEIATITKISSRLLVNRQAFKTRHGEINMWIQRFQEAVSGN